MSGRSVWLHIPGKPMGKQRPRVTKFATFTPKETVNYETLIREVFAVKYPAFKLIEGAVGIDIEAVFPIPASWSKKKKAAAAARELRHTSKPDWDNIGKIVTDALNGFAYKDDSQAVDVKVSKWYGEKPGMTVYIVALDEEED